MSSDFIQGGVTPIPVAGGGPSLTDPQPKNPTNYVNAATLAYLAAHNPHDLAGDTLVDSLGDLSIAAHVVPGINLEGTAPPNVLIPSDTSWSADRPNTSFTRADPDSSTETLCFAAAISQQPFHAGSTGAYIEIHIDNIVDPSGFFIGLCTPAYLAAVTENGDLQTAPDAVGSGAMVLRGDGTMLLDGVEMDYSFPALASNSTVSIGVYDLARPFFALDGVWNGVDNTPPTYMNGLGDPLGSGATTAFPGSELVPFAAMRTVDEQVTFRVLDPQFENTNSMLNYGLVPWGTPAVSNLIKMLSAVDMGSKAISNLADPVNLQDAATMNWVNAANSNTANILYGNLLPTTADNLTADGGTQVAIHWLTSTISRITAQPPGVSPTAPAKVMLPGGNLGHQVVVINNSGADIQVWRSYYQPQYVVLAGTGINPRINAYDRFVTLPDLSVGVFHYATYTYTYASISGAKPAVGAPVVVTQTTTTLDRYYDLYSLGGVVNNSHYGIKISMSLINANDPSDYCYVDGFLMTAWVDGSGTVTLGNSRVVEQDSVTRRALSAYADDPEAMVVTPASSPAQAIINQATFLLSTSNTGHQTELQMFFQPPDASVTYNWRFTVTPLVFN